MPAALAQSDCVAKCRQQAVAAAGMNEMKKKIVISNFSALSYEVVVQGIRTTDPGLPRCAHPGSRLTPVNVEGLNVPPESLAERQPIAAPPTFDKTLNPLRGEGTGNLVLEIAGKAATPTAFGAFRSHYPRRCSLLRSTQSTPRVDISNRDAL
jgi:hypothetical protein